MDEYKKSPLWKNAYALGKELHRLTRGAHPANTILRLLREMSEGLTIQTAIYLQDSENLGCAESIKEIFEHAHDTENLLFLSLFCQHLSFDDVNGLFARIYEIKRDIVVLLGKAKVS